MQKLKIAIVAPVEEQVPPKKYGGTELVVYNLAENLVAMGHDVTVFASGDSMTSAKLVPIYPTATRTLPQCKNYRIRQALTLIGAGKMAEYIAQGDFDLVHNHIGWWFLPFINLLKIPTVTTFHGFLKAQEESEVYKHYKDLKHVSISMKQREPAPPQINFIANVYNGIEVSKFKFFAEPKDYFAYLARISHEKGTKEAILIAKAAGVKLVIAGKIDPMDEDYFKNEVEPLVDGEQIKFIGEIGHVDKVELLGNAKAMLAPIQWDEPFGLYFIESMICGTPVIANNRGSVPEIIINGKTGFIVNDINEAAEKIKVIDRINREDCHKHVKENFSAAKMAAEYLAAYEKAIAEFHQDKSYSEKSLTL